MTPGPEWWRERYWWFRWWAWYPVRVGPRALADLRWLREVECRTTHDGDGWLYRDVTKETS